MGAGLGNAKQTKKASYRMRLYINKTFTDAASEQRVRSKNMGNDELNLVQWSILKKKKSIKSCDMKQLLSLCTCRYAFMLWWTKISSTLQFAQEWRLTLRLWCSGLTVFFKGGIKTQTQLYLMIVNLFYLSVWTIKHFIKLFFFCFFCLSKTTKSPEILKSEWGCLADALKLCEKSARSLLKYPVTQRAKIRAHMPEL